MYFLNDRSLIDKSNTASVRQKYNLSQLTELRHFGLNVDFTARSFYSIS